VIRARGVYRWQIGYKLKLLEELLHDGGKRAQGAF
jgi:hypothetical protein